MFCMEGRKFDPLSFLHGYSKVRKILTRTPALPKKHRDDVACGAHLPWRAVPGSVTRKVRMNANFFLFAKIRPLRTFRVKTAPQKTRIRQWTLEEPWANHLALSAQRNPRL